MGDVKKAFSSTSVHFPSLEGLLCVCGGGGGMGVGVKVGVGSINLQNVMQLQKRYFISPFPSALACTPSSPSLLLLEVYTESAL